MAGDAPQQLALGVDLGTSGVRVALMDPAGDLHHQAGCTYPGPFVQPQAWQQGLIQLCGAIPLPLRRQVAALAVAGTSGTLLAMDAGGCPWETLCPTTRHSPNGQAGVGSLQNRAILPRRQAGPWPEPWNSDSATPMPMACVTRRSG